MAKKSVERTQQSARNDREAEDQSAAAPTDASMPTTGVNTAAMEARDNGMSEAVKDEVTTTERKPKRPRITTPETQPPQQPTHSVEDLCRACYSATTTSQPSLNLLECSLCHVRVHPCCYGLPVNKLEDPSAWTCESCDDKASEPRLCVFCLQAGDACMRRVDTAHWPTLYRPTDSKEKTAWAHAMCAWWNPFHTTTPATPPAEPVLPDLQTVDADDNKSKTETETPATQLSKSIETISKPTDPFRARLDLPVPSCSFCAIADGVRVQCRRLHCGRFFHARCAHASPTGFVEVVHTPFPLQHAYCNRHAQTRHDLRDLVTKLLSKTMASLVPRDVAIKVQAIARRIDAYTTVDAVFTDLVSVLEDMCKKGLTTSKTDPQTFSMRQLQALQLVLDHLPQLRNVYNVLTLSKTDVVDFVHDAEVTHALQKAFHPQRFVRKFAGPLSQFHHCDACHEPFQERQHIFYCFSTEQTHALHWRCTKRKAAAKESRQSGSASAKKKAKSLALIQQGHWKEVKLPKGFPSIGEGITCGVCRAAVDARGVIAGRKEARRIDFEKPSSAFMYGGCFVNEMDPRTASAAGLRTSRVTAFQSAAVAATGGPRMPAKSALRRSASGASATMDSDGEASALLGPPKMERINVRRTTRWLACLAQVIRLVLAAKKEAKEAVATYVEEATREPSSGDTEVAEPSLPEDTSSVKKVGSEDGGDANAVSNVDVKMDDVCSEPRSAVATDATVIEANAFSELAVHSDRVVTPDEERRESLEEKPTNDKEVPLATAAQQPPSSSLPVSALAYLEEAKSVVRAYDAYALSKMESAHRMFDERNGPALSVLHTLIQEYTRFMYIKHTRTVAKASNEKRKREEHEAQEARERERKRIDREAELALKNQMLAMRKKQRA